MAASVHQRPYAALQHGVVRAFKPSPSPDMPRPKKLPQPPPLSDSSSDDEDHAATFKDLIRNAEVEASVLDPRDDGTSDHWIERNASLFRLTGKHPFNSEPPLPRLMHHGFITPVPLHYVRNHGPVPRARWEDWTVEVTGLVARPTRFTMDQLLRDFPSREFPATLVCAGNRRKEQNMGALHVCFEGAEDLPGGGGSKYGTSIMREVALDPSRDIILAYMQNGERLTPDHGFPVRMIIPGFIGGRMIKWLKRIIVTTQQSQSYYHYQDNRVLPSHVDAELANAEAWWYKPEYIINELNINSVITTPCHDEILPINSWTTQIPYLLRGYAYSGGGRKVTRVEVTLDGGETWQVCTLDCPEKPNKYGKYWCWCFWSLEVEVLDLLGAKEIAVRAWDEALNTQPEKLIWNVMGMMNNCWFRVKTNVCKAHKGEIGIVFEHPTQAGNQSGGWMAKEKHLEKSSESNPILKKSVSSPFMNTTSKTYSISEVRKHNSPDSAWIIVHGYVYDCTRFLKDHPGGTDSILINAGTDCTEEFEAIHSDKAKKMLEDYRIGELMTTGYTSDSSSPNTTVHDATHLAPIKEVTPQRSVALTPREKTPCKLLSKTSLSHDVRLFRFSLPSEDQLAQAILKDPEDRTQMHVVYANRTQDDILLREELDDWAQKHDRFKVCVGFITESILREHVPHASPDTLALTCGPPPMIQFAVQPNLEKLGYDIQNNLLVF
uniref:nitrate reductase (NADH) n=1 Tax=Cajanus cajan TaxID=3821 RepID=A0A151RD87_CAJCA|nr:Inducible nitrate reductase [NADH] 2 [Cajanus cajan]